MIPCSLLTCASVAFGKSSFAAMPFDILCSCCNVLRASSSPCITSVIRARLMTSIAPATPPGTNLPASARAIARFTYDLAASGSDSIHASRAPLASSTGADTAATPASTCSSVKPGTLSRSTDVGFFFMCAFTSASKFFDTDTVMLLTRLNALSVATSGKLWAKRVSLTAMALSVSSVFGASFSLDETKLTSCFVPPRRRFARRT